MRAQDEIKFLERLYKLEVPTMDAELSRLAKLVSDDLEIAAQRAGKDGVWCFECGASRVSLARCRCDFGDPFGCGNRLFCGDCRAARQVIAGHLERLFAAKKVDRVSSVRLRLLRELRSAARDLEGEDSNPANERFLSFWLSNADEFGDSAEAFRAGILRAFRQTRFLDFAALANALERQREQTFIRQMIRAGLR